jgi:hypothetical protein
MPLKDLLKKKEKIREEGATPQAPTLSPDVPEFTFMRTTTSTQDIIEPPSHPQDPIREQPLLSPDSHKKFSRFRRHSNAAQATPEHDNSGTREHKLFGRNRASSSVNVPQNLPDVAEGVARNEDDEARWEKRATVLIQGTMSGNTTPHIEMHNPMDGNGTRSGSKNMGNEGGDVCWHLCNCVASGC